MMRLHGHSPSAFVHTIVRRDNENQQQNREIKKYLPIEIYTNFSPLVISTEDNVTEILIQFNPVGQLIISKSCFSFAVAFTFIKLLFFSLSLFFGSFSNR